MIQILHSALHRYPTSTRYPSANSVLSRKGTSTHGLLHFKREKISTACVELPGKHLPASTGREVFCTRTKAIGVNSLGNSRWTFGGLALGFSQWHTELIARCSRVILSASSAGAGVLLEEPSLRSNEVLRGHRSRSKRTFLFQRKPGGGGEQKGKMFDTEPSLCLNVKNDWLTPDIFLIYMCNSVTVMNRFCYLQQMIDFVFLMLMMRPIIPQKWDFLSSWPITSSETPLKVGILGQKVRGTFWFQYGCPLYPLWVKSVHYHV